MTDKETKPTETRDAGAIVWMDPHSLIPYENNPRKNDKAVAAVAASIKEFGFNVPITVDENLVVATGHTRLKAALKLGMGKVPVIVLKGLSESQIKAWRLADNKTAELATWDEDKPTRSIKHPTMKPVRLMARLIANSSREGELVLDSFGGSGSTMIACQQLGRRANLMELDPKYVDVIIDRWEALTGEKAVKAN